MVQTLRLGGALCALLALIACSSEEGEQPRLSPDGGAQAKLAGAFRIELKAPTATSSGLTSLLGSIFDGPSPSTVVWEEKAKQSACRLLTPRVPFCSTACSASTVCVEDDTCEAYPSTVTVGTVQVKGVKTTSGQSSFTMDPVANNYQPTGGTTLAYPPFAEGDDVEISCSAFSLAAKGTAPLTLLNASLQLDAGKSATLSWPPPQQAGASTIEVKLDLSHHGGSKGKIECVAEDTGSLELPATLLDQLQKLGVSGFPTVVVTREVVGSAPEAVGQVELIISSSVEQAVVVPGLTSCSKDEDCPSGQTCQVDLRCE